MAHLVVRRHTDVVLDTGAEAGGNEVAVYLATDSVLRATRGMLHNTDASRARQQREVATTLHEGHAHGDVIASLTRGDRVAAVATGDGDVHASQWCKRGERLSHRCRGVPSVDGVRGDPVEGQGERGSASGTRHILHLLHVADTNVGICAGQADWRGGHAAVLVARLWHAVESNKPRVAALHHVAGDSNIVHGNQRVESSLHAESRHIKRQACCPLAIDHHGEGAAEGASLRHGGGNDLAIHDFRRAARLNKRGAGSTTAGSVVELDRRVPLHLVLGDRKATVVVRWDPLHNSARLRHDLDLHFLWHVRELVHGRSEHWRADRCVSPSHHVAGSHTDRVGLVRRQRWDHHAVDAHN